MNQAIERYRVWRVETEHYCIRYSLTKPLSKAELIAIFHPQPDAKIFPVADKRMKNGGKK